MTTYAFAPAPTATVAIAGTSDRFPVRRIFCVGQNYTDHVIEMGGDTRKPPFFFTKPADAVVDDGETVPYPPATEDLHYEAELVVAIGTAGADIAKDDALSHVWGYGVGNDLTRRDLQAAAKEVGKPWDMSKGFDNAALCAPLHQVADAGHPDKGAIRLTLNGNVRQNGDLSQMIWSVPEIISYLSGFVTLKPGDLVFTGTPAGVGPLVPGDTVTVEIDGLGTLTNTIA